MTTDLIPARMLNEYVYCPRLFYLEWVDARWADSDDTAEGSDRHRQLDRRESGLPAPEDVELMSRRTTVRLSSDRLGVLAVIDWVEADDDGVVPVDLKKGVPPDQGVWPADRAQVLAQAALLIDAGCRVKSAIVYYAATHQRRTISVTAESLTEINDLLASAREVAEKPLPPLPLVDSPKCPRCSLVGLCLPDETNALLRRTDARPRRIMPRDPDNRPLYVTEQGSYVGVRSGRITVTKEKEKLADVRALDVSQLAVFGRVQVSTQALADLWSRGVPVLWFSYGGWLNGWAQGEMSRYVELRRRQVATHAQGGFDIARRIVEGKIRNCRVLLRRNQRADVSSVVDSLGRLATRARTAGSAADLLGLEGAAARLYFENFTAMLGPARFALAHDFEVDGRQRRPATDPVNSLLSFTYSLLLKDLVAVCIGVGLDPFLGVYHRPRYGRPALALDLIEEFRPLIADSVVVGLLNNAEISDTDFVRRGNAAWLTPEGRKKVIRAYERRLETTVKHPLFGYRASYRRVLDIQARLMAAVMIGELDAYPPMVTR